MNVKEPWNYLVLHEYLGKLSTGGQQTRKSPILVTFEERAGWAKPKVGGAAAPPA